jgi:hypothetical protein
MTRPPAIGAPLAESILKAVEKSRAAIPNTTARPFNKDVGKFNKQ